MFTKKELEFIHIILIQLSWKTGQSADAKTAEDIVKKIQDNALEEKNDSDKLSK